MTMFLFLLSVAVFDGTILLCEGRFRRQIWPEPNNPDYFWGAEGPGNADFYRNGDFWLGPPRFEKGGKPVRNENGFRDPFRPGGGRNDRNQNRRTTTEALGPITSTPRTVHTAPRGCRCPMTQQFNPVCGTDGNTYRNLGLLNCYTRCGTNVSQKRLGAC